MPKRRRGDEGASPENLSYAKAGVDIDVTNAAKREMAGSIDRGDARVLNRFGAFASLLEGRFPAYRDPLLVMKTEEPGSKQKLAFELGKGPSIGYDLVNHLINDLMVTGAEPLYVQDCIVCGRIEPPLVTALVASMADACRDQGCVLCGGETSVQPGVVADGVYILTACAVGVVERGYVLDGSTIAESDSVLAVASNGPHTNGYTLVRKLLERDGGLRDRPVGKETFIEAVMRPHTCYYRAARELFRDGGLKGLAHITGGGMQDNLDRILPAHLDASVDLSLIRVPEVFAVIRREGDVAEAEMLRTFNMGVGLAVVCSAGSQATIERSFRSRGHDCYPIGRIVTGSRKVAFVGHLCF